MMRKLSILAALCASVLTVAAPMSVSAQSKTLTTSFAGGNFNDGIMFDLTALGGPVRLESIDLNADFGTFDYEIYFRSGGISGQQLNPAAWTLLNSFSAVQTAGGGSATNFDIDDLMLEAGSTYGVYVTDTGAFSTQFTNSATPSGTLQASDGTLAINVGYGVQYPFADATPDRLFNGALHYTALPAVTSAVPEPASWLFMVVGFGAIGRMLRRRSRTVAALA